MASVVDKIKTFVSQPVGGLIVAAIVLLILYYLYCPKANKWNIWNPFSKRTTTPMPTFISSTTPAPTFITTTSTTPIVMKQ